MTVLLPIVEVDAEHPMPDTWSGMIAPEGYRWAWSREPTRDEAEGRYDLAWNVPPLGRGTVCRQPRCDAAPAASLLRGTVRKAWWNYCADHLYGRMIIDGHVFCVRAISNTDHPPA